tara:strand:+ start:26239 stop:26376 length:138 start_codon:yes stop_codon:yes gene_type:complete
MESPETFASKPVGLLDQFASLPIAVHILVGLATGILIGTAGFYAF